MGYEHSLMLSTELVPAFLEKYDMRQEHKEGYTVPMKFTEDATPQSGGTANSIDVTFSKGSSGKNTYFEYNTTDKLYYVSQYGAAYKDDGNGRQVAVTNVLVLFAPTTQIAGDDKGRLDVTLTGSGEGYFACGGKYVSLTWSKADAASPFVYTLEDGSELVFGAGKSYINIVPVGNDVVFA